MSIQIVLSNDERLMEGPVLRPVRSVSKAAASLLAIAQLMLASVQLVENTVLVSLDADLFRYQEARLMIMLAWLFTVTWMLTIALLLYGIMTDQRKFILPHFGFSSLLLLFKTAILVVLVFSGSYPLSIVVCALTVIVLALSLRAESRCFAQMRVIVDAVTAPIAVSPRFIPSKVMQIKTLNLLEKSYSN